MFPKKLMFASTVALGASLLLAACGSQAPQRLASVPPSGSPSVTVPAITTDGRAVVVSRMNEFYNHFFDYDKATGARVVAALGGTDATTEGLTETQAKRINAAVEKVDPYFAQFYTKGMSAVEITQLYQGWITGTSLFLANGNFSVMVTPAQVSIKNDTATVTKVQLLKDGKAYVPDESSGATTNAGTQKLTRVNGQWFINPGAV